MSTQLAVEALRRMRLVTSFDGELRSLRLKFEVVNYRTVASSMLYVYDLVLTIHLEIDLVWRRKWTYMTVLYLLQRYLPVIDTLWLVLQHQLGVGLSKNACLLVYSASGWLFCVGFILSEVILTLRAFAIWERNKFLMIGLPIFFACCWVPDLVFMHLFLKSMQFGDLPSPAFTGCLVVNGSSILAMCWVVLMVYEAGIVTLMIIPGIEAYRSGGNTALYRTVYRDGVLYYVALLTLSTLNVVLINTLPHGYLNLLSSVERILHSVLTSRVILHLRQHCHTPQERWDGLTDISLDYDITPVGLTEDPPITQQSRTISSHV